jgi:hypothetical protein
MGNTARVLGIIALSLVIGTTSLFLLLFTICGGFRHAGGEEALLLAVCLLILGGGLTGIVFLARGISRAQPAVAGLPVPPAPAAGAAPSIAPAPATRLRGQAGQWLLFLRLALGAYICMLVGSAAWSALSLAQYGAGVALPTIIGTFIGLAPVVLFLLLLRDPPSALVLDLIGGMAAGSIVFRLLWAVYVAVAWQASSIAMPTMVPRLVLFTAIEAAIVALACMLRRIVARGGEIRLFAVAVAFLIWEWLSQTLVGLLYRFTY